MLSARGYANAARLPLLLPLPGVGICCMLAMDAARLSRRAFFLASRPVILYAAFFTVPGP